MMVGFTLAAQTVERELGLSWGAAQKALLDARAAGLMQCRENSDGTFDVLDTDLERWLKAKQTKPKGGKQPRIIKHLAQMFPDGVPEPAKVPRYELKSNLLRREQSLAPLDDQTLKDAIDAYNADPKRS